MTRALPSLSSDRLRLRPVTHDDLELMVGLNADPAVMTYVRGRAATREETVAEWRQRWERQSDADRGLGYWAGFDDGGFVGWWSASSFEGRPDMAGVGYRLAPSGWGRGLATEGARVMVRQAFGCGGIERVVASTVVANTGSRRVLAKLRMTVQATYAASPERMQVPDWHLGEVSYAITRADWMSGGVHGAEASRGL